MAVISGRIIAFVVCLLSTFSIGWYITVTDTWDLTYYHAVAINFLKGNGSIFGSRESIPSLATITRWNGTLTFWTSDLHDGCRIDTPSVLVHLGQRVILNGHKGHDGHYPDFFERLVIPEKRSNVIQSHVSHSDYMSEADIRSNFQYYQNDSLLAGTDAFICSFPASFCEMWMPFNKSIVFLPAHRFSLGRCSKAKLERLIEHVIAMNRIESPKHFIAAASVYDAEYINYYTGLKPVVLTSSSFFYAGHNTTNYTHWLPEVLEGPLQRQTVLMEAELKAAVEKYSKKEKWLFITAKQKYGYFHLQNIADHRAVVLFPYAVMSYGITELYAMGMPLFVPSIEMFLKYGWLNDRTLVDDFYCGKSMASQLPPKHPNSTHPFSPDSYDEDAKRYWFQFADYYQWPHITVFNDFGDLITKLERTDFEDVHQKMMQTNERREEELLNRWRAIIGQIEHGRIVPNNYDDAIRALWNTTQLQVE